MQEDAGILLSSLRPEVVLEYLDGCPAEVLARHPLAILVLMRSMFNWRQIPRMLALRGTLLAAIKAQPGMGAAERGNLLGECDLIMSFLSYNDISEMSRLHRSASRQMSRPAISIRSSGGWTFGSPSVLMMFHRAPGGLEKELEEMDECMPHYYKITNGHGQGAEKIMRAEAAFLQGRFDDAEIALEGAYAQIAGNGQENMALCCDFLAWRMSLCTALTPRYSLERQQALLMQHHNVSWLNIFNALWAYYDALTGEAGNAPEVFREHRLETVNYLGPGRPMMEWIENQVYLAQGAWARVIGRSEGLLQVCAGLHYALTALLVRIQTAAAYAQMGKQAEALALLERALTDARADGFRMPFVENYRYLRQTLERCAADGFVRDIQRLGEAYEARCTAIRERDALPAAFAALTEREREIAAMVAARLSNREIAEKLYLSEGSVKQYVNQIYSKLLMDGDTRTKRRRLAEMMGK